MAPEDRDPRNRTATLETKRGTAKKSTTRQPTSKSTNSNAKITKAPAADKHKKRSTASIRGFWKRPEHEEDEKYGPLTGDLAIRAHYRAGKHWGGRVRFETIIPVEAHPRVIREFVRHDKKFHYKVMPAKSWSAWHPLINEHFACFAEAGATTDETWKCIKKAMDARTASLGEFSDVEGVIFQNARAALMEYCRGQGMAMKDAEEEMDNIEEEVRDSKQARKRLTRPAEAEYLPAALPVESRSTR